MTRGVARDGTLALRLCVEETNVFDTTSRLAAVTLLAFGTIVAEVSVTFCVA